MNLKAELIYLSNRIFRFLYASAFTILFFEEDAFASYFFAEGLIPFVSIAAMRFRNIKALTSLVFLSLLVFLTIPNTNFIAVLIILVLMEGVTGTRYFAVHRLHNVLADFVHTIVLSALLILYSIYGVKDLVEFVTFLLFVSWIKLIYFLILTRKVEISHGISTVNSTIYRLSASQIMRIALVTPASSEWFVVAFRLLNQVVLYVWSFIKTNHSLELPNIISNNFFEFKWAPIFILSLFLMAFILVQNIMLLFVFYIILLCYFLAREVHLRFT